MDLFLVISQGVGLALAAGVRPFLPPLLAGALARADLGLDFDGTDFAFLESIPFLAVMLALTALSIPGERSLGVRQWTLAVGALAVALGALEFGGSLADEGHSSAPGVVAGAAVALAGFAAGHSFLSRAKERLSGGEPTAASLVTLYADGTALLLALVAILLPPVSWLALALCAWLLLERRRRAGRKYEGLRVLR